MTFHYSRQLILLSLAQPRFFQLVGRTRGHKLKDFLQTYVTVSNDMCGFTSEHTYI